MSVIYPKYEEEYGDFGKDIINRIRDLR
jgi:hypothetical protein